MTPPNNDCPVDFPAICAQKHWAIYWIIIVCSLAMVSGRVLMVGKYSDEDSPFSSANDRSRWCTVRALGDHGVWEIDQVINDRKNKIQWDSIDKVQHMGRDGQMHFYSSKPPLYPAMLAGIYRAIKYFTGLTLRDDAVTVARIMLIIVHVLPWALFLWLFASMIDRILVRDWTRYYVLASAGFGTYLTTFAVSINNHLTAAISVMVALYCLFEILFEPLVLNEDGRYVRQSKTAKTSIFVIAGLFSAFAVANELPALSFLGLVWAICLWKVPSKTIWAFSTSALAVAGLFFWLNYQAHNDLRPPYMHRGDGEVLTKVEGDFAADLNMGVLPVALRDAAATVIDLESPSVEIGSWPKTPESIGRWVVRDRMGSNQFAITRVKTGSEFEIRQWENWYDYPGSYWLAENNDKKSDVDLGESSRAVYSFHVLFGHHGIFSLTPIWLLAFPGMIALLFHKQMNLRWLGAMGLVISVVVIGFYIMRPEIDRNYGGVTSGLRWLFWLAPIWLVSMMPVVDWLGQSKWGRCLCLVLLGASVLSAIYASNNPWVHPWLYEIWNFTGLPA